MPDNGVPNHKLPIGLIPRRVVFGADDLKPGVYHAWEGSECRNELGECFIPIVIVSRGFRGRANVEVWIGPSPDDEIDD